MSNKLIFFLIMSAALAALIHSYLHRSPKFTVYTGDYFYIPDCNNLGLLGCTPHPTEYLKNNNNNAELLKTITIEAFLDIDYLRDSFDRTFALCKDHSIDHLLIAYLPIYFYEMRQLLGDDFLSGCTVFLQRMSQQMPAIIKESSDRMEYQGKITLIIPPLHQLARIASIPSTHDRIPYLIKQFPKLLNRSAPSLQTITIINNTESSEDDQLIRYLNYEYLFEKPLGYAKCAIGKPRFHKRNPH
jgi:hypothetical protein